MRRPTFDSTIDFGHILTIVVILIGLWSGFAGMRDRLTAIEVKLQPLWDDYTATHTTRVVERTR